MMEQENQPLGGDLGALAIAAEGIDRETAAAAPEALIAAQQESEEQAAVAGLLEQNTKALLVMQDLAMPLLGRLYPSLPGAVPDQDRQTLASVWAPVLTKHGIDLASMGGSYKEEIAAIVVTLPIASAIYDAIKTDIAERSKKKPIEVKATEKPQEAVRVMPTEAPAEMAGA